MFIVCGVDAAANAAKHARLHNTQGVMYGIAGIVETQLTDPKVAVSRCAYAKVRNRISVGKAFWKCAWCVLVAWLTNLMDFTLCVTECQRQHNLLVLSLD